MPREVQVRHESDTESVVKHWNGLPRQLPSLELFKKPLEAALSGVVDKLVINQSLDLMTLEEFSNLNNSVIL